MDFLSKFRAKAEKDPLVPVGCGATLACLLAGLYTFHTGQAALSQKMMRARVVAQAATAFAGVTEARSSTPEARSSTRVILVMPRFPDARRGFT